MKQGKFIQKMWGNLKVVGKTEIEKLQGMFEMKKNPKMAINIAK